MTENIVSADRAIELLKDVIAGKEDYVYEFPAGSNACVYVDMQHNPSCVVGVALSSIGVDFHEFDDETLVRFNFYTNGGIASVANRLQQSNPGLVITREARLVFAAAQAVQDNKGTWGLALQVARTVNHAFNELF